jgi:uncharacterized membrane protein YedE/YeeE
MPHAQNLVGEVIGWIIIFPLVLITLARVIGWLLGAGQPNLDRRPGQAAPAAPPALPKRRVMAGIHRSGRCCRECGEPHSVNEAIALTNRDRMAYLEGEK